MLQKDDSRFAASTREETEREEILPISNHGYRKYVPIRMEAMMMVSYRQACILILVFDVEAARCARRQRRLRVVND